MKSLNVSDGQQTPAGRIIGELHYGGILEKLLKRDDEYNGCPHDGGAHTLYLRLTQPDLEAFILLVKEHYSKKGPTWAERAEAFATHVKTKSYAQLRQ